MAWLGYTAYEAKDNLEAARDHAQSAKSALLAGDTGVAESAAAEADREASAAYDNTHSLPWNITAAIPVIGSPFESTRQMTEVVQGLTRGRSRPCRDYRNFTRTNGIGAARWALGTRTVTRSGTETGRNSYRRGIAVVAGTGSSRIEVPGPS